MKVSRVLRDSIEVYANNFIKYFVAAIIALLGSLLVITIPPLWFGFIYLSLKGCKGEDFRIKDLFRGFDYFIRSWLFFIAMVILVLIGLIPFLVSAFLKSDTLFGIFTIIYFVWGLLLTFSLFYVIPLIVDKNIGVVDGMRESIKLFRKNVVSTISLLISIIILVVVLSFIPVIGIFISYPFSYICISKATLEAQV